MGSHKAILVVEDEDSVRRYLVQLLQKHLWVARSARSGAEALVDLATTRPDVVLCDLDLGAGINGIELLEQMPALSGGTPFVLLTAHGSVDRCLEALRTGANDFLEKPISAARLFSSLDRATGVTASTGGSLLASESLGQNSIGDGHVRRALRVIEREFADPTFSVDALAKSNDMTSDHLARLFRTHLARKPLEMIHEARIRAAARLLDTTALSIYEVAVDCGFRNTTELDRWFKHFKRMTPSQWRDKRRGHS